MPCSVISAVTHRMESAGCKTLLAPSSCDNEGGCKRLRVAVVEVVEVMSGVDAAIGLTSRYCAFKSNKIYKYFQTQTQSTIHQNIFPNVYIWRIMRSSKIFLINEAATTKKIFTPATR